MSFLGFGKKEKVLDLASSYNDEQKFNKTKGKALQPTASSQQSGSDFAFLGNLASASGSSSSSDYDDPNASIEERRKRLAKRLMDLTDRIEDLSNQVYHITQRVELLEKRTRFTGSE
jgi:hypothetical protein